ncbi:MAG TPA: 50S ribosomal protein L18 [Candidatus Saccharimonadales bacterium]|nr:50S ribosomal protein L18 [Candidatus Saccharimonadales bacterium]
MNRLAHSRQNKTQRAHRVRANISGTTERPRLTVFISNTHVAAQIVDDSKHVTLTAVSTVGQKSLKGTMSDKAVWVGEEIAKKAKTAKVKRVVLDRGSKLYHGRIKALADAARKAGLEF